MELSFGEGIPTNSCELGVIAKAASFEVGARERVRTHSRSRGTGRENTDGITSSVRSAMPSITDVSQRDHEAASPKGWSSLASEYRQERATW
jgi:hypothetical protein